MHPDDCAELVAEGVEALRARAPAYRPDLAIEEIRLDGPFDLRVTMRVRRYRTGAQTQPLLLLPDGRQVVQSVPVLDLASRQERILVVRAQCEGFDGQPPLVELLDAGGQPLGPGDWPQDTARRGIVANHPRYKRPFFCRPGVREFHEHPQHEDDPWDRHREGLTLDGIVLSIVADLQTRFVA
jgi:hypothetical protein